MVDSGYFTAMRIPLVAGREFTRHDTAASDRVMIVNETMARRLWPATDAVGQAALLGNVEWRLAGVVANVRHSSLEQEAELEMYMPITQQRDWGSLELVVRPMCGRSHWPRASARRFTEWIRSSPQASS